MPLHATARRTRFARATRAAAAGIDAEHNRITGGPESHAHGGPRITRSPGYYASAWRITRPDDRREGRRRRHSRGLRGTICALRHLRLRRVDDGFDVCVHACVFRSTRRNLFFLVCARGNRAVRLLLFLIFCGRSTTGM